MNNMITSIFVDIDGTVADISHRVHHLANTPDGSENKDWDAFYEGIAGDEPIVPIIKLVNSLSESHFIIMITGRDSTRRNITEKWLEEHEVQYDALLMRPAGDHSADVKIKREWLKKMRDGELVFQGVDIPKIVIEDRKKVVDMWRDEGLIALHCDVGDF